ncbi:MAG: hypothetical protein SPE84_05525, partial [Bullifex sp.]|nr:hypothetical protein [Bullifex sp.]
SRQFLSARILGQSPPISTFFLPSEVAKLLKNCPFLNCLTKFFISLIQYLQNRTGINVIEQVHGNFLQKALFERSSRSFPLQADDKNSFTWKEKKGTFLYQSSHTRSG